MTFPVNKRTGVVLDPLQDGITHCNIYSKGNTPLGANLSFFRHAPYQHPQYGYFASLEATYHWIASGKKHDSLRSMAGAAARAVGKGYDKIAIPNFHAEIADAVKFKMAQYPSLSMQLMNCTLPLVHYWVDDHGNPIYPEQHDWIAEIYDRLRNSLQYAP